MFLRENEELKKLNHGKIFIFHAADKRLIYYINDVKNYK